MFKKFTNGCIALVQKYLPDAFLFAVILTIIVFVAGMITTGQAPVDMIRHWGGGFWSLLGFAMQMALVVVTGYVLADTKPVKKALDKLACIPKTPRQAIWFISFVSLIAMFINWGFGLVIGPLFARRLSKKIKGVDYRLLIASAYASIANWHGGISGSIPLKMATGGLEAETAGALTAAIPITETIFAPWNLIMQIAILIIIPLVNSAMHPDPKDVVSLDTSLLEEEVAVAKDKSLMTPAERVENSPILSMIIGIGGLAYIVYWFATKGFNLDLNIVNFIFLFLGIILHGNPRNFLDSVEGSVKGAAGVLIQFPFYAGIMGMMVGANPEGVSLAKIISDGFVSIATPKTFPLLSYLSAGIVNFFVPSGGGQWAVQAPIMMPAGAALGVNPAVTGMTIAWGDAWTNLIQPFWALPALGIAGLGARDIMGYCIIDLIVVGVITCAGFLFLV
ncbi:short-chain fatty acids transporter [Proteiniborus ethanoligenes]|uniref:Short-chain fatty acids transporter n=1 Tax=Proteiniborus ethanoligenes TaxID=415015 RepID=A0A1H3LSH3_9FIRM|nr:short-chain fatty acid transporter [Proteiniborus ethanoligenes]SDY67382.1 short-chain fatty acids transporter [Proteiniborus ethanoligenes]